MEPLSSYSHNESAEFLLIMNVCGENPIMVLLHQACTKHRSSEAKAFKNHVSQVDAAVGVGGWGGVGGGATVQIRPHFVKPPSAHV